MALTEIVTLDDVYPALGMKNAPPDGGLKLQGLIDAAQVVVEDVVGHVVPVVFDEFYDGGDVAIYLNELPVLSVTSIVETIGMTNYTLTADPVGSGSYVGSFGYSLDDPESGRITRRSAGSSPYRFYRNTGNIEVVYTAGRATVPANIRWGTLELIRHVWEQGQEAFGPVSSFVPAGTHGGDEEMTVTSSGYLIPNRVKEMLQPSLLPIVIV